MMVRGFGNLTNRVMEESRSSKPEVGMGATICHFSDRSAGTVVKVEERRWGNDMFRIVHVQEDKCTRVDKNGMSESQTYSYEPNLKGEITTWQCRVDIEGKQLTYYHAVKWNVKTKRWNMVQGGGMNIGQRDAYHDFSF